MLTAEQGPGNMDMLANQVPKASITALRGLTCCGCDKCLSKAIAAALAAWPGVMTERRARCDAVVLPFNLDPDLPQTRLAVDHAKFLAAVDREGDHEIGAGSVAYDPLPQKEQQ